MPEKRGTDVSLLRLLKQLGPTGEAPIFAPPPTTTSASVPRTAQPSVTGGDQSQLRNSLEMMRMIVQLQQGKGQSGGMFGNKQQRSSGNAAIGAIPTDIQLGGASGY